MFRSTSNVLINQVSFSLVRSPLPRLPLVYARALFCPATATHIVESFSHVHLIDSGRSMQLRIAFKYWNRLQMANIAINNLFTRCESQLIELWQNNNQTLRTCDTGGRFLFVRWPAPKRGSLLRPIPLASSNELSVCRKLMWSWSKGTLNWSNQLPFDKQNWLAINHYVEACNSPGCFLFSKVFRDFTRITPLIHFYRDLNS